MSAVLGGVAGVGAGGVAFKTAGVVASMPVTDPLTWVAIMATLALAGGALAGLSHAYNRAFGSKTEYAFN